VSGHSEYQTCGRNQRLLGTTLDCAGELTALKKAVGRALLPESLELKLPKVPGIFKRLKWLEVRTLHTSAHLYLEKGGYIPSDVVLYFLFILLPKTLASVALCTSFGSLFVGLL